MIMFFVNMKLSVIMCCGCMGIFVLVCDMMGLLVSDMLLCVLFVFLVVEMVVVVDVGNVL